MKKTIEIFQIDAFTKNPFEGNPAAVTFGDSLTESEMQSIAKEMNLAESAFLSKPAISVKADYNLRWFTPTTEVELCGHATIASLHFLAEQGILKENSEIIFNTQSGNIKCGLNNDKYYMQIPIISVKEFTGNKEEIIEALNLTLEDLDLKIPFIILENGNLYIYVKELKSLKKLKPNFNTLVELTEAKNEFSGVVVFSLETFEKNNFAHSRYFAPYYGINEDPVTGSANGPLLLVLKELGFIKDDKKELNFTFEQGDFLNRKGRVGVKYSSGNNELFITGNAVTILKGALTF